MNEKKYSAKFIIYLVVLVVVLDFSIGKLLEKLHFSEKYINNDKLSYSLLKTNENILIFGSSRAQHHYNTKIIEDSLKMSVYNVGSGGQNVYFHYALLKSILKRYKPKIIIMDIVNIDFEKTDKRWDTEKLGILLPFAKKDSIAMEAVLKRGYSEKVKMISSIYPFNSLIYKLIKVNFLGKKQSGYKGYIPLKGQWTKKIEVIDKETEIDTNKTKALFDFIELAKQNNCKVFVFLSPHYAIRKNYSFYNQLEKTLTSKYNVYFKNYEQDSTFLKKPEYFKDPLHLNSIGANVYTNIIVSEIKKSEFY